MKTKYLFPIETFVQNQSPLTFKTARAEISLVPDSDEKKNRELTQAVVLVDGKFSYDTILLARHELMKVLLRNAPIQAKIIDLPGGMPEHFEEIATKDDEKSEKRSKKGITLTSSARLLMPYEKTRNLHLRIDVDSDSAAIFCYYESMRKALSIDGFRELFKVIEYFCGVREGNQTDKTRILDCLGRTWWIPDDALQMARAFKGDPSLDPIGLGELLIETRGRCSHMRPDYGLTPTDTYGLARVAEMSAILNLVVRHTLEMNPETRCREPREELISLPGDLG